MRKRKLISFAKLNKSKRWCSKFVFSDIGKLYRCMQLSLLGINMFAYVDY